MKVCSVCGKEKDYRSFNYSNGSIRSWCKECQSKKAKAYLKTKHGISQAIYNKQKTSSKLRGHPRPNYSLSDFRDWLYSQQRFHDIYSEWVESEYDKWLRPSCDRIDDYKPYTFNNIRVVTWGDNYNKYMDDKRCGINTKGCMPVIQYSRDMTVVARYHSIREASRKTGVSQYKISDSCKGVRVRGEFIWKFNLD